MGSLKLVAPSSAARIESELLELPLESSWSGCSGDAICLSQFGLTNLIPAATNSIED